VGLASLFVEIIDGDIPFTEPQVEISVYQEPRDACRSSDQGCTGIAMFHQMHCLQIIRTAIVEGEADHHVGHCLNLLRQTVLCTSDTTLDALNSKLGTDGLGIVHVCRDWQKVYDFVEENQLRYLNGTSLP
jgi:hypothetical protein